MSFLTRRQHMGIAALLMGGSVFLSRFMGLFRDKVISYTHGASVESDIYFAAFVIPDFINYLLAGGYFSVTLIPLLSACFAKDEEDGWKFFSAVFWWVVIAIALVSLIAFVKAAAFARIAAPGFDAHASARLALFMRIILPAQVCFLPGACLTAMLYLRKQFTVPALTPLIYNGCIILAGLAFARFFERPGMEGFCWGVLIGAFLGSFVLPLCAVCEGGLHLRFTLYHPLLKKLLWLALPLALGQSLVALDEQFNRVFGSMVGAGAVSMLNYARRLMLVPVGVVAQAAGVASFPFLAELMARKDYIRFDETLQNALRNVLSVLIPLSAWMILGAAPLVRLIYQQGDFSVSNALETGALLQLMLLSVAFWGIQQMLGRAFYARQNTLTPALVGTVATLFMLPLYGLLSRKYGAAGVAMTGAAGVAAYAFLLGWRWRSRYGQGALAGMGAHFCKALACTAPALCVSAPVMLGVEKWLDATPLVGSFCTLAVGGIVFALIYLPVAGKFAPSLLAPLSGRVPGRLGRRFFP